MSIFLQLLKKAATFCRTQSLRTWSPATDLQATNFTRLDKSVPDRCMQDRETAFQISTRSTRMGNKFLFCAIIGSICLSPRPCCDRIGVPETSFDVMSYCQDEWISECTYRAILTYRGSSSLPAATSVTADKAAEGEQPRGSAQQVQPYLAR